MLNKTSHRLISVILSVALLATLFITTAVFPTAAEGESTNLLAQLEINPSVWSIEHDFSWNELTPDYSEDTITRQATYDISNTYIAQWPLLYDGVLSGNQVSGFMAGNASSAHNNVAWGRRVAIMYDLGVNYNLSNVSVVGRNELRRSVYRYSVYGSTSTDGILDNSNLLGRYSTTSQIKQADLTISTKNNVRYVMIVFDCVANDPGNSSVTHDYSEATQTVISQDRLVNALPGFGSAADGAIYIEEVVLGGTLGKQMVSVLGNGTENNNKDAKVYHIKHTVDYSVDYPDYSGDIITETTTLSNYWSSQIKTDGSGTFTETPTDVATYANILTDGTDLYATSGRTNEVWLGNSSANASTTNTRRIAIMYDLGGKYELENVSVSVPLSHISSTAKRYIHAFSVYGGNTASVTELLNGDPIATGGGKTAKVSAKVSSDTPVRYMLITFNILGSDNFTGTDATNPNFTTSDFSASKNGLVYLSEIAVDGYAADDKYDTNILAGNAKATLTPYRIDNVKFNWNVANQDYSEATATANSAMQPLNGATVSSVVANDSKSKLTNGDKTNYFAPTEVAVGGDNTNDIVVFGQGRSNLTENRQAVLIDLGDYYTLDSMQIFSTPKRFNDGRFIYDYTVFAGNSSDPAELLASDDISYGTSRSLAIGNEFASDNTVRYLLVVFDRVGTDPTTDYYGTANTLTVKNTNGMVYLTELEVYGKKRIALAEENGLSYELDSDNTVTVTVPSDKWLDAGSLYYMVGEARYPIVTRKNAIVNGSFNLESESNSTQYVFKLPSGTDTVTVYSSLIEKGTANISVMAGSATPHADASGKVRMRFLSRVYRTYIDGEGTEYVLKNCGAILINQTSANNAGYITTDPAAVMADIEAGTTSYAKKVSTEVLYDRCDDYIEYTTAVKLTAGGAFVCSDYTAIAYAEYVDETGENTVMLYADETKTNNYNAIVAEYETDPTGAKWYRTRGGLENTQYKLTNSDELNVVFIGGSITFGIGLGVGETETISYPALVTSWLQETYPNVNINMTKAAIGGAGSMWGAHCVKEDVLSHDPDLVFLEFAVNDSIDSFMYDYEQAGVYYESIIRNIRTEKPNCDIVALYTMSGNHASRSYYEGYDGALETLWYNEAAQHDKVAEFYDVPSVSLGYRLRALIDGEADYYNEDKQATVHAIYKYLYDGTHGTALGYEMYGNILKEALGKMLAVAASSQKGYGNNPCPNEYFNAGKETEINALMDTSYNYVTDLSMFDSSTGWTAQTGAWKGEKRFYNYLGGYIKSADNPTDNELVYTFTGTDIGLFAQLNNTDLSYGDVNYGRDNVKWFIETETVKTFAEAEAAGMVNTSWTNNYPLMLAENLDYGTHTIHIRWDYEAITNYNAVASSDKVYPTIAAIFYRAEQ